jgi:hypothetical protein
MLRPKPVSLKTALQDCSSSVTQLCDAAPKAVLHAAEVQRIAKLCKRLQPLLEELTEITAVDKQLQGVQLLQVTGVRPPEQCTASADSPVQRATCSGHLSHKTACCGYQCNTSNVNTAGEACISCPCNTACIVSLLI